MALQRGNLFDGHLLVSLLLLIVQLDVFFQGFLRINLRHAEIFEGILLFYRMYIFVSKFQWFKLHVFLLLPLSIFKFLWRKQLTFNWLNFFCISSIAFFKSSLSFWYIDCTFLTSFTWTKRWTSPSWRSSTWTSPAPPRWSPSSATTSCSLFGEPAPCLCSQLVGCCSTRWCQV